MCVAQVSVLQGAWSRLSAAVAALPTASSTAPSFRYYRCRHTPSALPTPRTSPRCTAHAVHAVCMCVSSTGYYTETQRELPSPPTSLLGPAYELQVSNRQ